MSKEARIHKLLAASPVGEDIEKMSFETIDRETSGHGFTREQWEVVRRVIHTTGDISISGAVRFSKNAIVAGISALSTGEPIYVDTNMCRSGLSTGRLRKVSETYQPADIHCFIADEDVARTATTRKLPRSVVAATKAKSLLTAGGIALFGNAPTGLLELNRLIIEEDVKPSLVIGAPVGFVNVIESKTELTSLDVPHIILEGRRGGSPIAVAILHALCTLAAGRKEKEETS